MTLEIRTATTADILPMTQLMLADAQHRAQMNPVLWALAENAEVKTRDALTAAMTAKDPAFRQQWLLAEDKGALMGLSHAIHLPVPPIYAGDFGRPGLLMEDCYVTPDAPPETAQVLLTAAEADLVQNGARILLASSVQDGPLQQLYEQNGYEPLTLYYAKSGLSDMPKAADLRPAHEDDVDAIVAASATHRSLLNMLHPRFWKPHDDADTRFRAWMSRSLTLDDRDMFVAPEHAALEGYAISQPATPLHIPASHDVSGIGVIDDYFHTAFQDTISATNTTSGATELLTAAEAARQRRGDHSVLVVCPAAWRSKRAVLSQSGYRAAITWWIKFAPADQ